MIGLPRESRVETHWRKWAWRSHRSLSSTGRRLQSRLWSQSLHPARASKQQRSDTVTTTTLNHLTTATQSRAFQSFTDPPIHHSDKVCLTFNTSEFEANDRGSDEALGELLVETKPDWRRSRYDTNRAPDQRNHHNTASPSHHRLNKPARCRTSAGPADVVLLPSTSTH